MKIQKLSISNFRAITDLCLSNLEDTIVIAGPNGCGKSCVFDAIRLLKSAYGGYNPNEWQSWFGEFQININQHPTNLAVMLQTQDRPLVVTAEICLSESERCFLSNNLKDLLEEQVWDEIAPPIDGQRNFSRTPLAANLRNHQNAVDQRVAEAISAIEIELQKPTTTAQISIAPDGKATVVSSRLLELVFSQYDPKYIGVIDYHGANRTYAREQVGGINLNFQSSEDRLRSHALYNSANKYANLKAEMASNYIRQLIAKEANPSVVTKDNLADTLKELFSVFFPSKEFLGIRSTNDGRLLFPVRTPSGAEHDINELSSGEKEVLYGYLRLHNAAPHHSVLLIDEPELHLNPRLISGLASFYHRHLGRSLDNQLWLVTHSDTLIREAVGQKGFSVFHMQPPGQYEGPNQVSLVQVGRDLDRLVIELVGDLATYRPGAKIVVFEGEANSEFDIQMTCTLFPIFQSSVNTIPGGNKSRVSALYGLLETARQAGHLPGKFYAITDSDGDASAETDVPTRHQWDVYHIENYLLEPEYILQVLKDLNKTTPSLITTENVLIALKQCAEATISKLVAHKLQSDANRGLIESINLGFDPTTPNISLALSSAIDRSVQRINQLAAGQLSNKYLNPLEIEHRNAALEDLKTDKWRASFRGREILKKFVGEYGGGIAYEAFRDLIIARMRDKKYQPPGMKKVIDCILSDHLSRTAYLA